MEEPHSIIPSVYDRRSSQLIFDVNAAVTQCHAVPIHHDLAHSLCGKTLDDIHGLEFRHWRATAAPTRLVGVCHKQVCQPRTVGASECTTHTGEVERSHEKLGVHSCENLRSKLSSGGDDLDQSIVGIDNLDRFGHSHAAKIKSTSQNHDAACDPKEKSSLLRS